MKGVIAPVFPVCSYSLTRKEIEILKRRGILFSTLKFICLGTVTKAKVKDLSRPQRVVGVSLYPNFDSGNVPAD